MFERLPSFLYYYSMRGPVTWGNTVVVCPLFFCGSHKQRHTCMLSLSSLPWAVSSELKLSICGKCSTTFWEVTILAWCMYVPCYYPSATVPISRIWTICLFSSLATIWLKYKCFKQTFYHRDSKYFLNMKLNIFRDFSFVLT